MSGSASIRSAYVDRRWMDICRDLDYSGLLAVRRRGLRNGNWRRLSLIDRGLFRCALWVAKVRGGIGSLRLLVRVLGVVLKLLQSWSMRVWMAGRVRAEELKRRFEERSLFDWAPQVKDWLNERAFIFHLGLGELYVS